MWLWRWRLSLPSHRSLFFSFCRQMKKMSVVKSRLYSNVPELYPLVEAISALFETHLRACFGDFRRHCIRDMTDGKPVSVFLKESFLEGCAPEDVRFFDAFFETQIWAHYSDQLLREADSGDTAK